MNKVIKREDIISCSDFKKAWAQVHTSIWIWIINQNDVQVLRIRLQIKAELKEYECRDKNNE